MRAAPGDVGPGAGRDGPGRSARAGAAGEAGRGSRCAASRELAVVRECVRGVRQGEAGGRRGRGAPCLPGDQAAPHRAQRPEPGGRRPGHRGRGQRGPRQGRPGGGDGAVRQRLRPGSRPAGRPPGDGPRRDETGAARHPARRGRHHRGVPGALAFGPRPLPRVPAPRPRRPARAVRGGGDVRHRHDAPPRLAPAPRHRGSPGQRSKPERGPRAAPAAAAAARRHLPGLGLALPMVARPAAGLHGVGRATPLAGVPAGQPRRGADAAGPRRPPGGRPQPALLVERRRGGGRLRSARRGPARGGLASGGGRPRPHLPACRPVPQGRPLRRRRQPLPRDPEDVPRRSRGHEQSRQHRVRPR